MKFSEYIAESTAYKNQHPITKDECIDYIRKNCNQMDYSSPLLRGMKGASNYIKIEEMVQPRVSRDGNNMHTTLLDYHFSKNGGYPLRSKSLICTDITNLTMAKGYGNVYAIFPKNNVKIGIVMDDRDIFNAKTKILGRERDLIDINFAVADFLGIKATSDYHDDKIKSVDDIKKIIDKKDFTTYREYNVDGDAWDVVEYIGDDRLADKEHIYKSIIKIYEPDNFNFDIITNKDIDSYSNIEAWFSGECVAIRYDEWKEIKDIL